MSQTLWFGRRKKNLALALALALASAETLRHSASCEFRNCNVTRFRGIGLRARRALKATEVRALFGASVRSCKQDVVHPIWHGIGGQDVSRQEEVLLPSVQDGARLDVGYRLTRHVFGETQLGHAVPSALSLGLSDLRPLLCRACHIHLADLVEPLALPALSQKFKCCAYETS